MTTQTPLGGTFTMARASPSPAWGTARCSWPAPASSGRPRTARPPSPCCGRPSNSGITHIDTSDFYGPYVTNEIIKEALLPLPRRRCTSSPRSARGATPRAAGPTPALPRSCARRSTTTWTTSASTRSTSSTCASAGSDAPSRARIAEPFTALAEMQQEGLIRHLGVSTVSAEQVAEAQSIAPVVCVQNFYNVAHRERRRPDRLARRAGHRLRAVLPARRLHAAAVRRRWTRSPPASAPRRWPSRWPGCCSARRTSC